MCHYSEQPGLKSISLTCLWCGLAFNAKYFHSGFSDVVLLYCDRCFRSVVIETNATVYRNLWRKHCGILFLLGAFTAALNRNVRWGNYREFCIDVEATLPHCECGGRFSYDARLRCPLCLREFESDDIRKMWQLYRKAYGIVVVDRANSAIPPTIGSLP